MNMPQAILGGTKVKQIVLKHMYAAQSIVGATEENQGLPVSLSVLGARTG
jgi:hypothetical protein